MGEEIGRKKKPKLHDTNTVYNNTVQKKRNVTCAMCYILTGIGKKSEITDSHVCTREKRYRETMRAILSVRGLNYT